MPNETILDLYLEEEDVLEIGLEEEDILQISLYSEDVFSIELIDSSTTYKVDYEKQVINKPKIEGVTVEGEKNFEDYNLNKISNQWLENHLN